MENAVARFTLQPGTSTAKEVWFDMFTTRLAYQFREHYKDVVLEDCVVTVTVEPKDA